MSKEKEEKKEDLLKKLEEEKNELDLAHKRALADYQNLLKTSNKEKVEFFKYALADFFLEFLPIFDNLKMAISTLSPEEEKSSWVVGLRHVIKQFQDLFSAQGVEAIKTVGEPFDYHTMEAVEGDGEIVKEEMRPGYTLKGKVIIPAKVILFLKMNLKKKVKRKIIYSSFLHP